MKKILLLLQLLTASFFATAQNIGIGTTSPQAKLFASVDSLKAALVELPRQPKCNNSIKKEATT